MDEPTKMEIVQKCVNDKSDSLEIGTPSKGGAIKVYGDSMNVEEFKTRIDNMFAVRQHAQTKT